MPEIFIFGNHFFVSRYIKESLSTIFKVAVCTSFTYSRLNCLNSTTQCIDERQKDPFLATYEYINRIQTA